MEARISCVKKIIGSQSE